MEQTLIDIAYDLAKTKFNKKSFTFRQLWVELVKKAKLDQKEQEQVGNLYTTMLQDHRFIFAGNDEWKVREFLTLEQQSELSNALYDFTKEDVKVSKKDDEMEGSEFNFDDEDDEYQQHAEASLDDETDEDDDEGEVEERDSDDEELEDEDIDESETNKEDEE